jgi:Arylsulfotransferase (ASST)
VKINSLAIAPLIVQCCLLFACKSDKTAGDTGGGGTPGELVPNCSDADPDQLLSLEIGPTEVIMVPVVRWSSTTATTAYVAYAGEDDVVRTTPLLDSGTDFEVTLRGVHASETVRARVVVVDGDTETCSAELSIDNEELPAAMPTLEFEGEPDDGYTLAPLFTEDGYGLVVLDGNGKVVYYIETDQAVWRARFARDGNSILFNHTAPEWGKNGTIWRAQWDGSVEMIASRENIHTDFDELPDGSLVTLEWTLRDFVDHTGADRDIVGDRVIQLIDSTTSVTLWDVFDYFTPNLRETFPGGEGTPHETAEDWSHTNGITYDEERNEVYVSIQVLAGIAGIDVETGEQVWSVSKDGGTVDVPDEATMRNPHSVYRYNDDQYLIFNRNNLGVECSDVTALEFTADTAVAAELWKYTGLECLSVYYLGEARPLPNDDILITWTTSGVLQRVTADRESLWTITSALGAAFGFSDWSSTLYPE